MLGSPIWAITSFYNPERYRRRLLNYRLFRKALDIPLITVELAYGETYELCCTDADILVQLKGQAVLWQKERLLNIALTMLPSHVQYVAWLDCDVVIPRNDWVAATVELLRSRLMVQVFSRLYDLPRDSSPTDCEIEEIAPSGLSAAYLFSTNQCTAEDLRPSATQPNRRVSFGLGWAAQRSLLCGYGFYDAMILGSGDRAMACAAYGRFEDAIHTACMDERRARHYMDWAGPFYEEIKGNVGFVDGGIFHLWHGDLSNRNYVGRHRELALLGFDPDKHLALDQQGCWTWTTEAGTVKDYIRAYFASRKEDGDVRRTPDQRS